MTQLIPIRVLKWMRADEAQEIDWLAQNEDQPVGYFNESSSN